MANLLGIFPLMFRARRPSKLDDMRAVNLPFWIRKGYEGMTFFGHIITHSKEEANHFNQHWDAMKNHEMIHLYQARSTHDSWLCFYWKYIVYWLKACRYRKHLRNAGYLLNPFEMEAYGHMYDLHYLDDKESGTTEWHRYASMSLEERLRLYFARKRSACD
ncbi:MAG: hypothetical protein J6M15_05350 [Prevotella sp.]|nr:hypothetical protein [Prevotella sp.]MBQ7414711.1 hypothetical protein [Prevotella sp.]